MQKIVVLIAFLYVSLSYSQITFTLNSNVCSGTSKTLTANTGTDVALSYTWSSTPLSPIFSSPNTQTTTITFPSSGTFTINLNVTLTSTSGSYSTIVNATPSPTISVTQSSPTTCIASNYPTYSQPVYLSASGASSYTWNPYIYSSYPTTGSVYARPSISTCYTVSGNNGNCISSAVTCVSVIPQYSFAVSPQSATLCVSDSLLLSVTNISTLAVLPIQNYTWYDPTPPSYTNPYTASITIWPSISCTYTVEIYDSLACVSLPALANITVANCTGIHSNSLNNNLSVYPNPFINQLTLNTSTTQLKKLIITNLLEQTIYTTQFYQNNLIIDLPQISSGTYIVALYINSQLSYRGKLIKQ